MQFLFLLAFSIPWEMALSSPATLSQGVAQVEVSSRGKRAISPSVQVRVSGLGKQLNLNVESPSYSIFTPNFQYQEALYEPSTKKVVLRDATPSAEELREISDNFYTGGADSLAALSLRKTEQNTYHVSGNLDDTLTLVHDSEGVHTLRIRDTPENGLLDYKDLNRTITPSKQSRAVSSATPEVFVIFDYANTQKFKNDRNKILDYLGVFFHAINNRYATAADPRISFRLSGVTTISSASSQPYMENNKVSGGYDIDKTLEDFSKWLYANSKSTPKYDLAALITGTDMKLKDSNGNYQSGVAGLAYMKAACWSYPQRQQYLGSSVTEDIGGYYNGMFSVSHELAHNLGAPHDGRDGDAKSCPWSQGYIMSYEGWGTKNKFYFSPCSNSLMKTFIDSQQGSCTKKQDGTEIPLSNDNIGKRMNMQQQCILATGSDKAVPDPDTKPDDLCKNLKCRYPHPTKPGWSMISTLNHPPGDDAPCGNGGKCVNGDCLGASG